MRLIKCCRLLNRCLCVKCKKRECSRCGNIICAWVFFFCCILPVHFSIECDVAGNICIWQCQLVGLMLTYAESATQKQWKHLHNRPNETTNLSFHSFFFAFSPFGVVVLCGSHDTVLLNQLCTKGGERREPNQRVVHSTK